MTTLVLPPREQLADPDWAHEEDVQVGDVELTPFAFILYGALEPLLGHEEDPDVDFALARLCSAAAVPFDNAFALIAMPEIPWDTVLDLWKCPGDWLDWLGRFKGVTSITGLDDDAKRERIDKAAGFDRGTPRSIIAAAQSRLTGSQHVLLEERTPTPWSITVTVYGGEVLNADELSLRQAIEAVKPAGIVLYLNALDAERWDDVGAATQWDSPAPGMTWDTATGL